MEQTLQVFMDYAAAFEETYLDDDWSRLAPFFAEDAMYEVRGGPLACKITGREKIFSGLKRSLDTLDRRCNGRKIDVTSGPEITPVEGGNELGVGWHVTYQFGSAPQAGFPGRSVVKIVDGVIVSLRDEYSDEEMAPFADWMAEHGEGLDGSYV